MNRDASGAVRLRYRGITPIATCHWQWIGNVLADRGVQNAWETLGLIWGCRWEGGSVLFGIARWATVLREVSGADVAIMTFDTPEKARTAELRLSADAVPFVAEIDEFYVPADVRERTHVVHAVLVLTRDSSRVEFVDSVVGPHVLEYPVEEYETMRLSPCQGRVEAHKLYAVTRLPSVRPHPNEIFAAVREHLAQTVEGSRRALAEYIAWADASTGAIDVCRAAGERYQAARLFEHLAREGVEGTDRLAGEMRLLSDDWYLVHMLASHEHCTDRRARARVIRLLRGLSLKEVATANSVLT